MSNFPRRSGAFQGRSNPFKESIAVSVVHNRDFKPAKSDIAEDYTPRFARQRLEQIFGKERGTELAQRRFQILKYNLNSLDEQIADLTKHLASSVWPFERLAFRRL
ncbi:MAG: hypothetical protein AUG51_16085 [Acidobacteria bacterium 13_1_20CM_3_53_8]|nr:MAG: hypothetical protein AUG51_16085 [Acidobacteria bacterium 13_1_20CM_3_53_8]